MIAVNFIPALLNIKRLLIYNFSVVDQIRLKRVKNQRKMMFAVIEAIVTSIGVRSTSVTVYFIGAVMSSVIDAIEMSQSAYAMSRLLQTSKFLLFA